MSKKLHVCIDGLNLGLIKGTGIATYARHLGDFLYKYTCDLSIVFDKNINEKASASLYEKLFYEAIKKLSEKECRPRNSIAHYFLIPFYFFKSLQYFIRPPRLARHFLSNSFMSETRLPRFHAVYNSAHLYRLAQCYFMIFGRLLPIKLSPTPDIMHWTCPIPMRVIGAKNYYTVHDLIPLKLTHATQENKKFFYDMMMQIAKSADKLITVSECSRNDILSYFSVSPEKVINTYQNVSFEKFLSHEERLFSEKKLSDIFSLKPKNYFIFVGAIEPKKNVARLLKAFISANVEQKLVVIGALAWQSEEEKALLEQHAARVIYLNYLSHDALKTVMRHARALVFPSLYEGFGLPVMEAMSLGVPVITSNISSLPEITAGAAYLVNPYDIDDISAAINRLSKDDALCENLAEKSKERASDFSYEAYAERLKSVYQL